MSQKQRVVVCGAGPVGALAALYAAERGDDVEVYELRGDPRDETTVPLNFTKSINLALSERGINAMRHAGKDLIDGVMKETIPMCGRMIHGRDSLGQMYQASQSYDVHGRNINAVDRWQLNKRILDALDGMPNVKFFFKHKLTGADYRKKHAWFEVQEKQPPPSNQQQTSDEETSESQASSTSSPRKRLSQTFQNRKARFEEGAGTSKVSTSPSTTPTPAGATPSLDKHSRRRPEIEISFDLLIGADGAHSAARYHLMKYARMYYEQKYIDTLWSEFRIMPRPSSALSSSPPSSPSFTDYTQPDTEFAISPHHLHIWPGSTQMFIAIPSLDRSFTCTLFAPESVFHSLRSSSDPCSTVVKYFQEYFPGVTPELIPESELVRQFETNPALPLVSIKCAPYHFGDAGVILGDAAHAMVPFYGQGMNAGLEDVRVLFECLDEAGVYPERATTTITTSPSNPNTSIRCTSPEASPATETSMEKARRRGLEQYSRIRHPDAAAINDLALGNYYEMRAGVVNPLYKARKWFEEGMSRWFPRSGWATQYARVSFTNERYSEVETAIQRQVQIEIIGSLGMLGLAAAVTFEVWTRWRR